MQGGPGCHVRVQLGVACTACRAWHTGVATAWGKARRSAPPGAGRGIVLGQSAAPARHAVLSVPPGRPGDVGFLHNVAPGRSRRCMTACLRSATCSCTLHRSWMAAHGAGEGARPETGGRRRRGSSLFSAAHVWLKEQGPMRGQPAPQTGPGTGSQGVIRVPRWPWLPAQPSPAQPSTAQPGGLRAQARVATCEQALLSDAVRGNQVEPAEARPRPRHAGSAAFGRLLGLLGIVLQQALHRAGHVLDALLLHVGWRYSRDPPCLACTGGSLCTQCTHVRQGQHRRCTGQRGTTGRTHAADAGAALPGAGRYTAGCSTWYPGTGRRSPCRFGPHKRVCLLCSALCF